MKTSIAFGTDHAGFELKEILKSACLEHNLPILDYGAETSDPTDDYTDFILPVVKAVREGARGILLCGSGIGMSIGANRFKEIRAALCLNATMATRARSHNNANILVLGSRCISPEEALKCLEAFLATPFSEEDRHKRRIEKLDKICIE